MTDLGRRERKKAATRARLLECASELFTEKGYAETSMLEITDAADVAPRTFYEHFRSKADLALEQFQEWTDDMLGALEARPQHEGPFEMLVGALQELRLKGYVTGEQRRNQDGSVVPPIVTGLLWADTNLEVGGRIYQIMVDMQSRLTDLFGERTGDPPSALEPRILAAALLATWFVSVNSLPDLLETVPDPPTSDELAIRTFLAYWEGLRSSFQSRESKGTRQDVRKQLDDRDGNLVQLL